MSQSDIQPGDWGGGGGLSIRDVMPRVANVAASGLYCTILGIPGDSGRGGGDSTQRLDAVAPSATRQAVGRRFAKNYHILVYLGKAYIFSSLVLCSQPVPPRPD